MAMSDIILKDAHILTMNNATELPKLRTVYIHNEKITKIVAKYDGKAHKNTQVIDCRGQLLMPSFKNGHSHVAMHFLAEKATQENLRDWLNYVTEKEKGLEEEDMYYLSMFGLMELARSGYTYTFDMYYHPVAFAKACVFMGFRSDVLITTYRDDPQNKKFFKEFSLIREIDGLVSPKCGVHALYTADVLQLKKLASTLILKMIPFYTHLGETNWENEDSTQKHGGRPLPILFKHGCFAYGGAIFHGNHLDAKDIEIMKRKSISLVTCLQSNIQLKTGLPNFKALLDAKINICIGTDGNASNKYMDAFHEMRLVREKFNSEDIEIPNEGFYILKMASTNVMAALKKRNLKKIASSQFADLILLDASKYTEEELTDPNFFDLLITRGDKKDVLMTMSNGKIIYLNGSFPTIQSHVALVREKTKEISERIIQN